MIDGKNLSYEEWAQLELAPDLELIGPAVRRLTEALAQAGAAEPVLENLRLAVTEALTNSVRHGRARTGQRDIQLRWSWAGEWLEIRVSEPGDFQPAAADG